MKLINSRKAISKILENYVEPEGFYDNLEENLICPCWQIKVDRDRGDLVFLIDLKEVYSYSLKKLKDPELSIEKLCIYMKLFRSQDMKSLIKALKK